MTATTRLSSTLTVAGYKQLEQLEDRQALAAFVRERFNERYFVPILSSTRKHGFTMMAICCLVIETLESFYQGESDTTGKSRKIFARFFDRDTGLKEFGKTFGENDNSFYKKIRCGILHQSETKGGWRIRRDGKLLDISAKSINATAFLHELRKAVDDYADQLVTDEVLWANFKKKMKVVCDNCALGELT